jgi:uncharacterized membrane protein YfcA
VALATFLWLLLASVFAYFLKGFSGFGPAIVFVPSASYLFDPKTALVSSAAIDVLVGLALLKALTYERGELRLALRLALRMAVGSVVGATLAGVVPGALLLRILGVAILGFGSSLILFHRPIPVGALPRSSRALDLGCAVGGFFGGLVGISGPFVVPLARPLMEKGRFRRVLVALFLLEGVVKLAVYAVVGVWTPSVPRACLAAGPGVVLGLLLGFRSHGKVSERLFSALVGVILLGLGVRLLV